MLKHMAAACTVSTEPRMYTIPTACALIIVIGVTISIVTAIFLS